MTRHKAKVKPMVDGRKIKKLKIKKKLKKTQPKVVCNISIVTTKNSK